MADALEMYGQPGKRHAGDQDKSNDESKAARNGELACGGDYPQRYPN